MSKVYRQHSGLHPVGLDDKRWHTEWLTDPATDNSAGRHDTIAETKIEGKWIGGSQVVWIKVEEILKAIKRIQE